jgi:hypothetical protein
MRQARDDLLKDQEQAEQEKPARKDPGHEHDARVVRQATMRSGGRKPEIPAAKESEQGTENQVRANHFRRDPTTS